MASGAAVVDQVVDDVCVGDVLKQLRAVHTAGIAWNDLKIRQHRDRSPKWRTMAPGLRGLHRPQQHEWPPSALSYIRRHRLILKASTARQNRSRTPQRHTGRSLPLLSDFAAAILRTMLFMLSVTRPCSE
jgi:hypothetical protein